MIKIWLEEPSDNYVGCLFFLVSILEFFWIMIVQNLPIYSYIIFAGILWLIVQAGRIRIKKGKK